MGNLSLYIHIPFCVKKCNYCDFLSAPCNEETKQKYVDVLCSEIAYRAKQFKDRKVDTVFFGGGTPSILSVEQSVKLMDTIRQKFHILPEAEISMELNPGTVNRKKLETYQKMGINRLSIGLQSADNDELKILGRIHTWEVFLQTWNMVREVGFTNVNIDLMSALPGQTLESYKSTLRKVLALKPEHISAYSLIIEEGTKFYEWFGEEGEYAAAVKEEPGFLILSENNAAQEVDKVQEQSMEMRSMKIKSKKLPDEITDRQMYEMTRDLLEEHGYYRYEISNYTLPGYECKHNAGYWKRKEYLGLGLGAASLLFGDHGENIRSSNISDVNQYLKINLEKGISKEEFNKGSKWIEEQTYLTKEEQMEEFMFLGLRMMEGISSIEFEKQFEKSLQEVYGEQICKLEKQGLLEFCEETQRFRLTLRGIDVSNQVFVEFIE